MCIHTGFNTYSLRLSTLSTAVEVISLRTLKASRLLPFFIKESHGSLTPHAVSLTFISELLVSTCPPTLSGLFVVERKWWLGAESLPKGKM